MMPARRRWRLAAGLGLMAALAGGGLLWLHADGWQPPPFAQFRDGWQPSDAWLLDRHGAVLQSWRVDPLTRRAPWLALEQHSPALQRALLEAEDRRFEQHAGVDWLALGGAAWNALRGGPPRGASTLSMQVASRLDPALTGAAGRRGLMQKLRQMRAALALERAWSKSQIVEAYLNLADFRGELRGAAAAAQGLFGKQAVGLDDIESRLLAALLPAPGASPERVAARACRAAVRAGQGASCTALATLAERLRLPPRPAEREALAPALAARWLRTPGQRLATTLDAGVQRLALDSLRRQLLELAGRQVRDGAALVVDNTSGEVLAYVASAGQLSTAPAVDGVRAPRQAGSTLKPFLYALGLERGYFTAASVLDDSPVQLETGNGLYIPQNYERDFKGPVSLRRALAASLNVPAVRALVLTGVEDFRDRLRALGYDSIGEDGAYYGYSLALGSAEVSLAMQVNAYRTLANGGLHSPLRLRPDEPVSGPRRVLDAGVAWIVGDILADAAARAGSFGLDNPLRPRFWAAVKTGTSKDMRDNWCLGYTRRHTVGVWVGNFEGESMLNVSGISGAAPAWLEIMNGLHAGEADAGPPPAPPALQRRPVRFEPAIEAARDEWFLPGSALPVVRLARAEEAAPRITAPAQGAIIALDPDIPPARQRLHFRASRGTGVRWRLNGAWLSRAQAAQWTPRPGQHSLELVAGDRVLDQLRFTVRGPPG
jgi:penicillin-binding protein 1C